MAFRSISRNKVRTAFVIFGIMFSYAILTFMGSYSSMMDDMLLAQYTQIQVFDGKVTLRMPAANAESDVSRIKGVTLAEGYRTVHPVTSFVK